MRAEAERRYREMVAREEHRMAKQAELTWGDQKIQEGVLRGKRETLLRVLRARFTVVPEEFVRRIEAVQSEGALDALVDRAMIETDLNALQAALPN
jgi:hypothetical protein